MYTVHDAESDLIYIIHEFDRFDSILLHFSFCYMYLVGRCAPVRLNGMSLWRAMSVTGNLVGSMYMFMGFIYKLIDL